MKYSGSISDRIKALRAEMRREKIDLYIIPSTDYHNSEYIGEYFKERQYMTGFTGSAGTVVFTEEKAGLWTDGRARPIRRRRLRLRVRAADAAPRRGQSSGRTTPCADGCRTDLRQ